MVFPMTEAERQRDLLSLQDTIYRDKVERARAMTEQERFADVFELTDDVLERMLTGALPSWCCVLIGYAKCVALGELGLSLNQRRWHEY